jgi:predicted nucleic acid-binding protein
MRAELADDPDVVVWWGTIVEFSAAVARRERARPEGAASARATAALAALDRFTRTWKQVPPSEPIRDEARRLVRVHDLRAADAFQLAAALVMAGGEPSSVPFVTLDERLALAASREGFPILPATAAG